MLKKLKYMPYAQAKVYQDNTMTALISYQTDVLYITDHWLRCTGLYSMTTRRHISAFLKEYLPNVSFQTIKTLASTGFQLNLLTGEVAGF